ncbi:programmed cell death protein 2-like [Ornithodoros turicata]|uniref:programmed cell death protein 2-like n=1 Tax=Ornithodoros turicata TaxID=34597 RepID=UPI00313921D6
MLPSQQADRSCDVCRIITDDGTNFFLYFPFDNNSTEFGGNVLCSVAVLPRKAIEKASSEHAIGVDEMSSDSDVQPSVVRQIELMPNVYLPVTKLRCISWRRQRHRLVNAFYSQDPPQSSADDADRDYNPICDVCGVLGDKKCSRCKSHQFELVTEPEEENEDDDDVDERKRLSEYQDFLSKHPECKESPSQLKDIQDLQNMAATCEDKAFWKFRKATRKAPEQALRYELGGTPLWVSSEGVPKEVPMCDCGAERQFELQVMPQLLLRLDGVDWGTLTMFSCKKSCCCGTTYKEEYAWKQYFSNKEGISS